MDDTKNHTPADRRAASRDDLRPLTVAALPSDDGPCGFYRIHQPLGLLARQGKIELGTRKLDDGRYAVSAPWLEQADVTILQRLGGPVAPADTGNPTDAEAYGLAFLHDVETNARRVVYEIDDDLENVTGNSPDYTDGPAHRAQAFATRKLMAACRLVTTTTREAADRLAGVNQERRVIPNGVDLELWRPPGYTPRCDQSDAQRGDEIRIVYAASRNHRTDALMLLNPFRYIAANYANVRFVLAGARYDALMDALGNRIEYAGSVSRMADWPEFARSLRGDIWVAPLENSRFARSKSPLKWIEATAVGAAVVASDVVAYSAGPDGQPWQGRPPLGLARSTVEWGIALAHMVESAELRRQMVALSMEVVAANYTAQHSADAWLRVLEEVAGR